MKVNRQINNTTGIQPILLFQKEKVICLKGNNDNVDEIINMDINCFDKYYILDIDGFKFFCTHGDNFGFYNRKTINKSIFVPPF
ncbi:MAG: hypothetical protein ACK5HP_03505 [Bacilli bacterium]